MSVKVGDRVAFWQNALTKKRKYKGVVTKVYLHGFVVRTKSGCEHVMDNGYYAHHVERS